MKKYDVIVIAGTSESRAVIEEQLKQNKKILACVATDLGAEMLFRYDIDVHTGRLDEEGFIAFFKENRPEKIIDATHPFAKIVTQTVKKAAAALAIPYERYERAEIGYDYEKLYLVADAKEAVDLINEMEGNVLLTTGVNTAAIYAKGVHEAARRVYIRVLDTKVSHEGCDQAGYPRDHVIAEMPPFNLEDNLRAIDQTQAKILVSKDSGKTGGVDIKLEACRQRNIPMILIQRPQ